MANKSDNPPKFRRICVVDRVGYIVDNICDLFDAPKSKFYNALMNEALKNKKIVEDVIERLSNITDVETYNEAMDEFHRSFRFDKSSSGKKRGRKPLDRDSEGNIIRTNAPKEENVKPTHIPKPSSEESDNEEAKRVVPSKGVAKSVHKKGKSDVGGGSLANKRIDGELSMNF